MKGSLAQSLTSATIATSARVARCSSLIRRSEYGFFQLSPFPASLNLLSRKSVAEYVELLEFLCYTSSACPYWRSKMGQYGWEKRNGRKRRKGGRRVVKKETHFRLRQLRPTSPLGCAQPPAYLSPHLRHQLFPPLRLLHLRPILFNEGENDRPELLVRH